MPRYYLLLSLLLLSTTPSPANELPQEKCPIEAYFKAARSIDCETLRQYLNLYDDCKTARDSGRRTAAMMVAGNNKIHHDVSPTERDYIDGKAGFCIQVLDSFQGAMIDARDQGGRTAVFWAAANGMPKLLDSMLSVPSLLEKKVGVMTKAQVLETKELDRAYTALHAATTHNHLNSVKILIQHGANVRARDRDGQTCIMKAAVNQRSDIAHEFIEADKNTVLDMTNKKSWTACHHAVFSKSVEMISSFIHSNACPFDVRDRDGNTPYTLAVAFGLEKISLMLLHAKVDRVHHDYGQWEDKQKERFPEEPIQDHPTDVRHQDHQMGTMELNHDL